MDLNIADFQHRIKELLNTHLSNLPHRLHQAIRYATLEGGKRLRPLLVYGAGLVVNAPVEKLDNAAMAVECIHAYSLIHDDLPAMDNDDYRRGKSSCHKKFDEATAILAGDALQSLAFEFLAKNNQIEQITLLAKAIGCDGMVLGQSEDMNVKNQTLDQKKYYEIHRHKTGKLFTASVQLGLLCGNASKVFETLSEFAENFGLAFQLRDDLLDKEFIYHDEDQLKVEVKKIFGKAENILNSIQNEDVVLLKEILAKMYT